MLSRTLLLLSTFLLAAPPAAAMNFTTDTTQDYLLVGRIDGGVANAVDVGSSNSLGQIFTVPSAANPDVNDTPDPWPLPAGATAPVTGLYNDGNVAVTHQDGTYAFSGIDIWADKGVRCVDDVLTDCREGWSSSSLTGGSFANDASEMADVETELVTAALAISSLTPTSGWSVSGDGSNNAGIWDLTTEAGVIDDNTTITLAAGLNVIQINTGGNDFSLNNAGLVISGPGSGDDSTVVFLLQDQSQNFLFTNASVTMGSNIDDDSILFAMLNGGNDSNFDFSKVILNGVAFWDLSLDGGEIGMDNVQGCTQLVGDKISLQNVQLNRCAFAGVPEPQVATHLLVGLGTLLGLGVWRSRR